MPDTPSMPLATVEDVQARTDVELSTAHRARVTVLIEDASALVNVRVPDLPDPPPATVTGVISTAVLRALAAPPDGNVSETVGGHSRIAAHAGGGLYLTDDELDLLRPPAPVPREAFTIWTI